MDQIQDQESNKDFTLDQAILQIDNIVQVDSDDQLRNIQCVTPRLEKTESSPFDHKSPSFRKSQTFNQTKVSKILQLNNSPQSRCEKDTDNTQQKKREREMEQWSSLRTKIQYSNDGIAEYPSLKAVLRNRVQFNVKNKQIMERIERRYRLDHSDQMAHPEKIVQIVWKEKGKDNTNKSRNGDKKEEEKKSLIDQFNEAYDNAILRVTDEQSFYVHGKMIKFGKNSLGVLENKNKFRWAFAWLATSKYLERFIIFVIMVNSILMGIKDYKDKDDSSPINAFIAQTEPYFTGIFTAESVIRIVAMGFFMGNNTYLSDGWNWLDFIVVITSLLNQIPGMVGVSGLRTFRLFRPLRSLTSMPSMKLLVETLLSSIFQLGGVLGLVGFFFTIFAILGISLWSGSIHYRCYTSKWPDDDGIWHLVEGYDWLCVTDDQCGDGNFCGNRYDALDQGFNINITTINQDSDVVALDYGITNFDNFYMACLTILQCITLEGWSTTMEFFTYSQYDFMVVIYFVAVTIVCALFLLNLTIAVMLMKYQENDKSSAGQNHILELKNLGAKINLPIPLTNFIINNDRLIVDQKALAILKAEETFFQSLFKQKQMDIDKESSYYQFFLVKMCLAVIENKYFEAVMIVIILMNTICLAIDQDPPLDDQTQDTLYEFNIFFMIVFCLEIVFKSIGLGLKSFFREYFNIFDLSIVIVSLLEITVLQNSRMLSSLRAFRLFKIFKLFNSGDLRILIDSITFTLRSIADYSVLLALFIYVFALLGATFFAGNVKINSDDKVDLVNGTSPQNNYDNLFQSVLTVFCVMIGDNWNNIMYVIMRSCGHFSAYYFISLIIMGHIIMLNLFLAILLGNFDKARNFAQKQKVFDAFSEILIDHTLTNSIDLIFGEMSFYVKTRVLKWEKNQLEKIQADQLQLLKRSQKIEILDQNNDNLFESPITNENQSQKAQQAIPEIKIETEIQPINQLEMKQNIQDFKISEQKSSKKLGDQIIQKKQASIKQQINTPKRNNGSKFVNKIKEQKITMQIESQVEHEIHKNEQQALKKLKQNKDKLRIENPNILRMCELNRMVYVSPFEGLKEILRKEQNLNDSNLLSLQDNDIWQLKYLQKKFLKEKLGSIKNIKRNKKLTEGNKDKSQTFKQRIFHKIFDEENIEKAKEKLYEMKHKQITEISRKIMKDYTSSRENKNYIKAVLEEQKRQSSYYEESSDSEEADDILQNQENIMSPQERIKEYVMNSSLFIFHKDSSIRQLCLRLAETPENNLEYLKFLNQAPVEVVPLKKGSERIVPQKKTKSSFKEYITQYPSKIFDDIILVCIISSSVMLALDNPLDDPDSVLIVTLSYIGIFFTIIFLFEFTVKVIAKGFLHNNLGPIQPYIYDAWNVLDFIIVCSSTLDLVYFIAGIDTSKLKFLKALRALRALRPMKVIQKNDGMRLIVKSLLASIPSMSNVLIVVGLIMLIFSIMGVSLFKGTFYQCVQDDNKPTLDFTIIKNKDDCLSQQGLWQNLITNFDNTPKAMDALFGMMTTEGWIAVMFQGMNAMGKDLQPAEGASVYSVFYFLAFMIVGSQFLMNLFVGVVIDNFQCIKEKEELDNIFVTYDQRSWIEIQRIGQTKSLRKKNQKPIGVQLLFYQLVHSNIFDNIISLCIILNTVIMAIQYYQMPQSLDNISSNINLGLSSIFNIELICKLIGFGKVYFYSNWNIFDMVIVIITDAGILVDFFNLGQELRMISTIIRSFRIMRMLKLIRSNIHMRLVLDTCFNILPQMSNVMSLFLLMFFIFGTLGMNLFSSVMHQNCIDQFFNFETFPHSILILIRFSTGESWNQCMYEYANTYDFPDEQCQDQTYKQRQENGGKVTGCGTQLSYIYFYLFVIIVQILLMNLSVAAVIEGLETSKKENMGVVQGDQIEELIDYWEDYDLQATGWITAKDLVFLLYELPQPLGKRPAKIDFLSKEREDIVSKSSSQGLRNEDRYLVHTEKNVVLKKTHALELLSKLDIKFHDDPVKQVNFVDVFKALVNRVFEEKKIDYEVTEQLQSKVGKGWLRNFNTDSKDVTFYTIQEQQAGELIVLWSKKILSKQKNNFKIKKKNNRAEEENKMGDDNQINDGMLDKKEIDQTEILKKSALLIQKMINNEKIDDEQSEKSNVEGYAKEINQYTWLEKKNENQEIIDFDENQVCQDDGYFELFNYKQ